MTMQARIEANLRRRLDPVDIEVIDDSERHRGHGGWREGGETHFNVKVVSAAFQGKSRIERHRLVHAALAQELADGVHALAIVARAPDE